ncbi:MAG TPA: hypothetical protein VIV11_14325 [Kofleriaceae bacterium]
MAVELTRAGFVIENEWYWKLTEGAQTFDAASGVRDFLAPLARHAKAKLAITELACEVDEVRFALGEVVHSIKIFAGVSDRAAVNRFVGDVDRALSGTGYQLALVVPRRYELRGVLLTDEELRGLAGNPVLLAPVARASSPKLAL